MQFCDYNTACIAGLDFIYKWVGVVGGD